MQSEIDILLDVAKSVAALAFHRLSELYANETKQHTFLDSVPREMKSLADQVMEEVIIDQLASTGVPILSEESGKVAGNRKTALRFIVDPLDGTVNFIRELAPSSISIALFENDTPMFGVLAIFPSGDIAWGGKKIGAFMNEQQLFVSKQKEVLNSVLCTGFPSRFKFDDYKHDSDFLEKFSRFGKVRMLGAASLSLLQVAKGSAEMYFEKEIMLWDVAAGLALVEGAGGEISVSPGQSEHALNVIATNSIVPIE